MNTHFQNDLAEILKERAAKGQISRRQMLQGFAALMGTTALGAGAARAQEGRLVFVNWGGDALDAMDEAFGTPFTEETGIEVLYDGSGPTEGAITAQVQGGNPTWDLVDADPFSSQALGRKGLMEPIDYDIVDEAKQREGFGWEYSSSCYFYSYVIAYDATRFDEPPTSIADFFDTEKFPGKRAMYKWGVGMWEALLLGDGVARSDLYPLDLDHAGNAPEVEKKIDDALDMVGLTGFDESFPRELSGGMQMRASIARAMVTEPNLLLMDEPFGALDEMTRNKLNDDVLKLWREKGWTIVFVTHSVYEAVYLSSRVVVMAARPGRIVDDIEIKEPYPRSPDFRVSTEFAGYCRQVSMALERASAMGESKEGSDS